LHAWKADEIVLLGTLPDVEVVRMGRTALAVRLKWTRLGITTAGWKEAAADAPGRV
jgi:hypothetical protein